MSRIQNQVKLPLSVAFDVVMQGIRIRFGRSVVTIMGVVLGIAFLMAMLTGQNIKESVTDEDALRREVDRMNSFLVAEMGPVAERTVGVLQTGKLSGQEERFLTRLKADHVKQINWATTPGADASKHLGGKSVRKDVAAQALASGAKAVVVVGDGTAASTDVQAMVAGADDSQLIVATSRKAHAAAVAEIAAGLDTPPVVLERELKEDELSKIAKDRRRNRFRRNWIIIISMFVTVIGITNAMLMSVTERFREIGTMKCLGALSSFIRSIFLLESSLMGLAGGVIGGLFGVTFATAAYGVTYGFGMAFSSLGFANTALNFLLCVVAGVVLSIVAAIYPANVASRMVPADALRSNI